MDFKPYLPGTDSVRHIVHREIAHFWAVVLVVTAIVGSLYAYDSAVAQGVSDHHRMETPRISSLASMDTPFQCRQGARNKDRE